MKRALLIILLLQFTLITYSQNSVYPKAPFSKLYLVDVENDHIFTAGGCDIIMISSDGGTNWETLESQTYSLSQIKIVPGTNGKKAFFLFRSSLKILDMTTKQFEDVSDDNLNSLSDNFKMVFTRGDSVYIVDDVGIFKAKIGEYNWEMYETYSFDEGYIRVAGHSDNYVWFGMSTGKTYKFEIDSRTITETFTFAARIYNIEMANDTLGYITYQGGSQIFKTTDGGQTFNPLDGMPETSSPVAMGENLLMTINTNRIYVSLDGGATSQYMPMPSDGYTSLNSGHFLSADTSLYLVGTSGMIMKTDDLCQSFIHLNAIQRENLQSICLNENGEGYAVGGTNHVVHTTDGGENWYHLDLGLENNYYQSVVSAGQGRFLIGSDKGILTMENNAIINTDPSSCYFLYNSVINDDIFAIRNISGLKLSVSSDRGESWQDIGPLSNYAYQLHQTSSGRLFTINSDRQLIFSNDHGVNWEILPLDGFEGNVSNFSFLDDNNGVISAGNKLYTTNDGGNTATQVASGYALSNIYMFSKDHFSYTYATNDWTTIQETTDGGLNWENTGFFCTSSLGSFYDSDKTIWYAQKGGHINKHEILEVSGVSDVSPRENLSLTPNPVRSGDFFKLNISTNEPTNVYVYDISGRLRIKEKRCTAYTKISTSELEAGTYFLKVISMEGNTHFGKLLVNR